MLLSIRLKNILIALSFCSYLVAQGVEVRGVVTNVANGEPVPYAVVQIDESLQWCTTNADGQFLFKDVKADKVNILIRCLGYQSYAKEYVIDNVPVDCELFPARYDVKEVVVTAEQSQQMSTASSIQSTAIEHVQSTSLKDVLQLIPGHLIENPDLSEVQMINVREVKTDYNSGIGTAIIIDGAAISNDANFQTLSTAHLSSNGATINNYLDKYNNSLAKGVDLRQISTDNIERIEVIKGIPSVEYGDLTSGAVLITTKSGYSPYEVKIKTAPKLKQVHIGKGIKLNANSSFNTDIEYTDSHKNLHAKYRGFKRLTGQLGYSKVYFEQTKPFSFNTKLAFHSTLDEDKTDPDLHTEEEIVTKSERGLRLNNYGQWALNSKYITNVNYSFNASVTSQEDYELNYRSSALDKAATSFTEGLHKGVYIPSNSLAELKIEGLPVYANIKVFANKYLALKHGISTNILFGGEYNLTGNYGNGSAFDLNNPPVLSSLSARPRSFKEKPSSQRMSFFVEDKLYIPISGHKLELRAGLRINNFKSIGVSKQNIGTYYEPRVNARYVLLNNPDRFFKNLTLHGGIGSHYKLPPMIFLYPDLVYYDLPSLDYYPIDNTDLATAYFDTRIFDSSNSQLKPSHNLKKEIGIDVSLGKVRGNITAFKEEMTDGFGLNKRYHFLEYDNYDESAILEGERPDLSTLPFEVQEITVGYSYPVNSRKSTKLGVEYDFDLGKIEALSTSITMNGAWLKTHRIYNSTVSDRLRHQYGAYEQVGVYPSGDGVVLEQMNTTFRFVTHSPKLRLILTSSIQILWIDKYRNLAYEEVPLYLYDKNGTQTIFTDEMLNDINYRDYLFPKSDTYFVEDNYPPLVLCNFRLSKEILEHLKFSIYANNFINHQPVQQSKRTLEYSQHNISLYFGAELIIRI